MKQVDIGSNNGGGYPDVKITVDGCEELASALKKMSEIRFHAAAMKSAQSIYERGVKPGGTPVDTGELRQSLVSPHEEGEGRAVVGYLKHYAPHVEFGHRTRGGGYVQGQHFLQRNVEQEREAFKKRLKEELDKLMR